MNSGLGVTVRISVKTILCVGTARDIHCQHLGTVASDQGVNFVLLNPFRTRLRLDPSSGLEIMGTDGAPVTLDPDVVLLRSRFVPRIHDLSAESIRYYQTTSAAVGFCQLLANHFADRLINRREPSAAIADKLACARLIDQCGLHLPETLVASDLAALRSLADRGKWIVKFLGHPFQPKLEGDRIIWRTILTQRLDPDALEALPAEPFVPVLVQKEVERRRDWRVFTTRAGLFAAHVDAPGSPARVDGRLDFGRLKPVPEDAVPTEIREGAARLLRAAGLHFAVFDVLEDPKGCFWWVDINANGQWAELDALHQGRLARHFVTFLTGPTCLTSH